MEEISRSESEYVAAISNVLAYVQKHLQTELTPAKLAAVACFSPHHFHRIFRAVVGESMMEHVRRLRLEKAAYQLKTKPDSISWIAYDAGYPSQEVFTRIFRTYFGVVPRDYRHGHSTYLLPTRSGIHYAEAGFTPLKRAVDPELLQSDLLCPAHRLWPSEFETHWELFVANVTGLASFVYPLGLNPAPTNSLEIYMPETLQGIDQEISSIECEIELAKQRLLEARKRRPKEWVEDYLLLDIDNKEVRLSELFGDKPDLIIVHNMGTGCVYCTMWADGFNGLLPHLADRAAFALCSPDKPDVQKRFASKRNWNFKIVSTCNSSFAQDNGCNGNAPP